METKTNKNLDMVIYILLALLLMAAWRIMAGLPYNAEDAPFPVNYNFFVYVTAILGVCAGALVLFLATGRLQEAFDGEGKAARILNALLVPGLLACAAALLLLVYRVYRNENTLFPGGVAAYSLRQNLPPVPYFAAMVIPAFLIYLLGKSAVRQSRAVRWVVGAFISFVCALYEWCPDPYADTGAGLLHIDAYTTTIINTAQLVPFDNHHINIYGHHGILYLPLVRLFGNNYKAVALAIAVFTFITFLAIVYTADVLIERDLVFFLTMAACLGTCTLLTRSGVYFQIVPHRLLIPALGMAYLAWEARHPREGVRILRVLVQFLIVTAGFVWNFETALFTAAVLACCAFLRLHYDKSWFTLRALGTLAVEGALVVLSFAGGYGIVLLYNRLTGGRAVTVREFIYPLLSGTYDINNLRVPLPSVGHLFFLEILLFGFTLLPILRGRMETAEEERPRKVLAAGIALSGLSSLIYFINRTAYGNLSIATLQMALLMGHAADIGMGMDRENLVRGGVKAWRLFRYALGGIIFFVLFWMSIESVLYVNNGVSRRMDGGWNTAASQAMLTEIAREVPKDTLAYGIGLPQIYYELDWDPQIRPTDYPDMNEENREYIRAAVAEADAVFTSRKLIDPEGTGVPENFSVSWTYQLGPFEYMYCVRQGT